jgi:hypothetical protein
LISWRTGAVLLLLLAGLAVYAYATRPRPAPPPPPAATFLPCPSMKAVLVRIEGGGRTTEIQRATPREAWRVTQPVSAPTDPDSVQYLVGSIDTIKVLNTLSGSAPSSDGLEAPREILTCRVNDGRSYNLSVGNPSFDGSGYYARKSGDGRVFVISGVEVDAFDQALAEPPVKPSPSPRT